MRPGILQSSVPGPRPRDARGRYVRAGASTPAFDAAGSGRRTTGWNATTASLNSILFASAATLVARSRDMARKNPWAATAIERFVSNAVGTGIRPKSRHPDPAMRKAQQQAFQDWSYESDAHGVTDFYGQQGLAVRAMREAGEVFVRRRFRRPEDGLSVPMQLQLIEAEHVPHHMTMRFSNGNRVRAGIEFNAIGHRVAYHMYPEHPGEPEGVSGQTVRVPASEILHLFVPLRPGQVRGQPALAQALLKIYDFEAYEDGELVRKRDSALQSGFITEAAGQARSPLAGEASTDADGTPIELTRLESGTWQKLRPGEDVKPSTPADMGEGYNDFMRWVLRAIAAVAGVTYEQLTGDLTGVNYSSIRAGLLEFRRAVEMFQHTCFIVQFCRPVWRWWVPEAVLAGALPVSPSEYRRDPQAWLRHDWVPQGWQWVDPAKEVKAAKDAIRAGLDSRRNVVAGRGEDVEEIDQEIFEDQERADALGLTFDSDGRQAQSGGASAPAAAPGDDADDRDEEERETGGKRSAA